MKLISIILTDPAYTQGDWTTLATYARCQESWDSILEFWLPQYANGIKLQAKLSLFYNHPLILSHFQPDYHSEVPFPSI